MQDYSASDRPWVIIASFPMHKPTAIWRTCHRADADAYVRFLQRHISEGTFYVVFDDSNKRPDEDSRH